ncbi:MAG: hypothetical protein AB1427_05860 [Thermodesulfobacteriota bacterium]
MFLYSNPDNKQKTRRWKRCPKKTEPDPRAGVPRQEEAWVDAIQQARHPSGRDKAAWGLVEEPAGVGDKQPGRAPVAAKEKAVAGSNTHLTKG